MRAFTENEPKMGGKRGLETFGRATCVVWRPSHSPRVRSARNPSGSAPCNPATGQIKEKGKMT